MAGSPFARPATTLVLALVVLSPVLRRRDWDSFPVSSYPMFSRGDVSGVRALVHVVLVDPDGTRRPASPSLVGSPEPMVAMMIIAGSVQRGTTPDLCRAVASRARLEGSSVSAVEIVTSHFDMRKYFSAEAGAREPQRREVHARCEVGR